MSRKEEGIIDMGHEIYAEGASRATGLDIEVLRCLPDTELLKMIPPSTLEDGSSLTVEGANFLLKGMCFIGQDGNKQPHRRNAPEGHLRQGRGRRRGR